MTITPMAMPAFAPPERPDLELDGGDCVWLVRYVGDTQ